MDLPAKTIENLQTYVATQIKARGFEHESLQERLLLLTEEVGELVKACRKINGIKIDTNRPNTTNPAEELADVLNMVFAVAIELGVDLETEYGKKEKIIDERNYKRMEIDKLS